jgi:hypothetical protein
MWAGDESRSLAQRGVHGAAHLDADLRRSLLVIILRVDQLRLVIRQALLHRLAVELLQGDGLDRADVRGAIGVDEREPAADEILREGEATGAGGSASFSIVVPPFQHRASLGRKT